MSRAWWGPRADEERRAVLALVDDLAQNRLARSGDEDIEAVDRARGVLADHGLWTLGVAEDAGGGGADLATTLTALARIAGTWPALAWASLQAHAAAVALADAPHWAGLLEALHAGSPVAAAAPHADEVGFADGRVTGVLDRLDPAATEPHVVLLLDGDIAVALAPGDVTFGPAVRRTGLDGARTISARVDAAVGTDAVVCGPAVARARVLLDVGAAALAAGIAEACAQAALAYAGSRVQFGATLTALPTVRSSLLGQAAAARAVLASSIATGLDAPEVAAGALAPAFDVAIDVAAAAVQSHGGYGYMAEYLVEGLLRDAVSLRAASRAAEAGRRAACALVGRTS